MSPRHSSLGDGYLDGRPIARRYVIHEVVGEGGMGCVSYCVGTSKSGTHSIAGIFASHYRAAHEPEVQSSIELVLATQETAATRETLLDRDRRLSLDLEASNLLAFIAADLVAAFPAARFVMTIRDCYAWLDSCLNHQMNASRGDDMAPWWPARPRFPRGACRGSLSSADDATLPGHPMCRRQIGVSV